MSGAKNKVTNSNITLQQVQARFSLSRWRGLNPKYLKLSRGLFKIQEESLSKELSKSINLM